MKNLNDKSQATLVGLLAVVFWSALVGLFRGVSEQQGAIGGAALIYTVAALILFPSVGPKKRAQWPSRQYVLIGGLLFVTYEICFALSIGFAQTSRQAIEVSMVNYLWPAMTMVFSIVLNKMRTNWLIVPGCLTSIFGVLWVLGGEQGVDMGEILANLRSNPLCYLFAFLGALIWSFYCTISVRISNGKNGIALFFALTSLVLWIKYWSLGMDTIALTAQAILYVVLAGCATSFGYAAWNVGMARGNVAILTGSAYFIPVFSVVIAAQLLHTALPVAFWQGAALVCIGSLLCWVATRVRTPKITVVTPAASAALHHTPTAG